MDAVVYGGGNIGRGFIGALFSLSGYHVTFIDVAKPVVDGLRARHSYPLRTVWGGGQEDVLIENVDAVDGNDAEAVARAIAGADIMATAVGVRVLERIVPNIAAGLRLRFKTTEKPLNILICENLMDADKVLHGMLANELGPGYSTLLAERVGLVEASIGRMVPVQTPEMQDGDALRVCVERYGWLPVDRDAFKGPIPEVKNMLPASPFAFYLKRKLYLHNMGHATCAWLGLYTGREYIWQAIDDAEVLVMVRGAMQESAAALARQYYIPLADILPHIDDLLYRFTNRALGDTCERVGGDTPRKLAAADRMAGTLKNCLEQGVAPAFVYVGLAAGLHRHMREAGLPGDEAAARTVLQELCGLAQGAPMERALVFYAMFREGRSLAEVRRAAQAVQAESLVGIA